MRSKQGGNVAVWESQEWERGNGGDIKRHRGLRTAGCPKLRLQEMVAELRLPRRSIGRDMPSTHPPVACHNSEASVVLP